MSTTSDQVVVTSEWMTHYVGEPLLTMDVIWQLDSPNGPIIFYADPGPKGHLMMFKNDGKGGRHTVNVSLLWNHPPELTKVSAIAAYQDKDDLIYLAVAGQWPWFGGAEPKTQTHVECFEKLDYARLEERDHWTAQSTGTYTGGGTVKQAVPWLRESNVKLSYSPGINGPRLLCLQRGKANKYTPKLPDDYCALVEFKFNEKRHYSGWQEIKVPASVLKQEAIKFAVATMPQYTQCPEGYFTYWSGSNNKYLDWNAIDGSGPSSRLLFDGDLLSLTTLAVPGEATDCLVGSDRGLFFIPGSTFNGVRSWGFTLAAGNFTHVRGCWNPADGSRQVWGVQDGTKLGYAKVDREGRILAPFTVVTTGNFWRVSPSMARDGEIQRLLYSDTARRITLLERSPLGIWTNARLSLPVGEKIVEESCYVTHVRFQCNKPADAIGREVTISCTSAVTAMVNDQIHTIDSNEITVPTDGAGKLQIIQLNSTLATPHIIVKDAALDIGHIDPAQKVKVKFSTDLNASYLQQLKTATGNSIFPQNTDFEHLSSIFRDLKTEMGAVPQDGSARPDPGTDHASHPWDLLHAASQLVTHVGEIFFRAGHFIIQIGQEIKQFFISCFEQSLKCLETIVQAAGASMADLQHWLGWVFNWDDILATQRSLVALAEVAGSAGDDLLDYGFEVIDTALVSAKARFQTYTQPSQNSGAKNSPEDMRSTSNSGHPEQMKNSSHTGIDYFMDKLSNVWSSPMTAKALSVVDADAKLWTTTIPDILKGIENDLLRLKSDLGDVFAAGSTLTLGEALSKLGKDLLVTLIDTLRGILRALKEVIKPVIHSFLVAIQKPVNVPLLSPLYKYITKTTEDPALHSLVMLIIAVPTTIIMKLCEGEGASFPVYQVPSLHTQLFNPPRSAQPHTNMVMLAEGTESTTMKQDLWAFYSGPLWNTVLKGFDKMQAYLIAGSFTVQNVLQTWDSLLDPDKLMRFSTLGRDLGFETFYSLIKLTTQVAYIPVLTDPNGAAALEVRFLLWGSDWIATILDINAGYTARSLAWVADAMALQRKKTTIDANTNLQMAFGLLAFVYAEVILEAELTESQRALEGASQSDTKKRDELNGAIFRTRWAIVEAFGFVTNRVGILYVPNVKDIKARVACAGACAVLGEVAVGSAVMRFKETPDADNFQATT